VEKNQNNILWIASYPKTGSTWLKEIINQIISPDHKASDSIPSFQKTFPSQIPVHSTGDTQLNIVKTHLTPQNKRMREIIDKTHGAILIYRHPLDVMLSSINYAYIKGRSDHFIDGHLATVDELAKSGRLVGYLDSFIELDGMKQFLGSSGQYSQYINSWLKHCNENNLNSLVIKYEDMLADPIEHIQSISDFLAKNSSPEYAAEIMERCEALTSLNGKFFWKKKAGNYFNYFNADDIQRFENKYRNLMPNY
jgi:hypothetical protein